MPRFTNTQTFDCGFGFNFSGTTVNHLTETGGYTLANVAVDITGSTEDFAADLQKMMVVAAEALKKASTSANILLRVTLFNSRGIKEVHGFIPVRDLDPAVLYTGVTCDGMTNLIDAHIEGQEALFKYARFLYSQNYDVNTIAIVITDGAENDSKLKMKDITQQISEMKSGEYLESHLSIVIGVNDANCASSLQSFVAKAQIDHYMGVADATPASLAKVARIVSSSVSSQSQARGTGKSAQLTI